MRAARHPSLVLLPFALVLSLSGCDAGGDGGEATAGDDADDDGPGTAGSDDGTMEARCETEERDDDFSLGLTHEGSAVRVAIADADPALPIRGDNTWTLAITDESGAAMQGMSLVVTPWMPDHGHGSPVQVKVTALEDGEYELTPLNLFMAGYWEITIGTTDVDGLQDEVMFKVCVE